MAISIRNEGSKVNSNINVTPMVDVMLVLLIIFMVITPMLQEGVTVDLAKANNPKPMPDAEKEDALIVAVMKDGSIFFDTQRVAPEELTQKVKDRLDRMSNKNDKEVYVKADAR
ncbi:MAG TPA: biopolymer transporter ExbD, partial [Candidatus Angelobacter sp.]|nr:biopolymer transporter ExbD [Candidatus Angelobacter sp.]